MKNAYAKAVRTAQYRQRVERKRKGRGSYNRQAEKKSLTA